MKRLAKLFDRVRSVNLIILYLIGCVWLFMPLPANGKDSVADEIISIDAEARPLSEVLENISEETGFQFSLHESWADFPVTASFTNEPLHKGLKMILRRLNNAIIFGSDGTIKIMIYGEISSSATSSRQPVSERIFEEPIRQSVPQRSPINQGQRARISAQMEGDQIEDPSNEEESELDSEPADTGDDEDSKKEDEERSEDAAPQVDENLSEKNADRPTDAESSSEESDNSGNEESEETKTTN